MTLFMLAFVCIVPAVLIVVTLPHPDALPPSRGRRLRRFLLLNLPWISAPFLLDFAGSRLTQAGLPVSSWFNFAQIVVVPLCFTLLLIQPWTRRHPAD
ncbi:MAG: hypothetical protein QHC67_14550 [Sphingobium sp.]|jgi:hypothetical protein|uniref:hypothetical protein n=1 Tax=Sphingobium sp. TaxID=1912891 RepID=UPI0029B1CE8A|nr:hypothetical protein [Sphingobium sp.]MDX3911021.1 hypothetical protein [Sphingobium sp.]